MSVCYIGLNKIHIMQFNKKNNTTPIIFLHGLGATSYVWASFIYARWDGFYQIVLDLPGHGKSKGDGFRTIEGYADFIDSLVEELGINKFILVGHSIGGAIGLQYAMNFPMKLKGLVLISTGSKFRIPHEILYSVQRDGNFYKYLCSESTPLNLIKKAEAEYYKTNNNVVMYNDLLVCNQLNITDKVNRINTKTCIICGEDDLITPPKFSKYLNKNILGSQIYLIKKAGHMVIWEQPDTVTQLIYNFLINLH
jgi:pimeloyl-ACP methyl ester carboxylesterase